MLAVVTPHFRKNRNPPQARPRHPPTPPPAALVCERRRRISTGLGLKLTFRDRRQNVGVCPGTESRFVDKLALTAPYVPGGGKRSLVAAHSRRFFAGLD